MGSRLGITVGEYCFMILAAEQCGIRNKFYFFYACRKVFRTSLPLVLVYSGEGSTFLLEKRSALLKMLELKFFVNVIFIFEGRSVC